MSTESAGTSSFDEDNGSSASPSAADKKMKAEEDDTENDPDIDAVLAEDDSSDEEIDTRDGRGRGHKDILLSDYLQSRSLRILLLNLIMNLEQMCPYHHTHTFREQDRSQTS